MNTTSTIRQLAEEISSYRFSLGATSAQYEWLIGKCHSLAALLESDGAPQELIDRIRAIARNLAEEGPGLTHELVRQQTLVFQQDAIVFHLMKQGYAKTISI